MRCESCDSEIPSDAPGGECPRCLLQAGLLAASDEPFTPEELAAAFPQLDIDEMLGRGGMGVVYKARQKTLDRVVALKILPREVAEDPRFAERFGREARALARLAHPNIVTVHEAGRAGDLYFLLMEYVDGANLRSAMQAGGLTPEQALAIVPQVCDALQYAHDQGIVHRDIEPENILLDREGRVKIADFGLAKLVEQSPNDLSLTGTDQVMGTMSYIAPEQMREPKGVDHRADIYSLGVVFYEMLTGELPVGRFPPPSERVRIDVRLDGIVLRALESERELRYQRADDVKSSVTLVSSSPRAAAPPPPVAPWRHPSAPPPETRFSNLALVGVVALPTAIVAGFLMAMFGVQFEKNLTICILTAVGGVIVSVIAWRRIARRPDKLHGTAVAITGFVVPLCLSVLVVPGLYYLTAGHLPNRKDARLRVRAEAEFAHLRAVASAYLDQIESQGGMADLDTIANMIDPERREWFLDLPTDEFKRLYEAGELGLAMADRNSLPAPLTKFRIEKYVITDDDATVTIVYGGLALRFPMVKRGGKWYLAIGKVERLPWE